MRSLLYLCVVALAFRSAYGEEEEDKSEELPDKDLGTQEPVLYYHENLGIPAAKYLYEVEIERKDVGAGIAGGGLSHLGEHKFFAGLSIALVGGKGSVCGSTLLSKTKLVTAAHCWFDGKSQAEKFTVVLGSITLFYGGVRKDTNKVVNHDKYNFLTLQNDVAMITVDEVTFGEYIQPIALPTGHKKYKRNQATAVGFGKKSDTQKIFYNQTLSHVAMPIIGNTECKKTFGTSVFPTTLCASGAGGKSICKGDSGGPLYFKINNVATLVGITSFQSRLGCTLGYPAGFSRVTEYVPWITDHMAQEMK